MKASTASLLAAIVAVAPVSAKGTVSLDLSKRSHTDVSEPARIYKRQASNAGTVEESVYDVLPWSYGGAYYTNVTVGTPPQELVVILDTGSSNLYVDASGSAACKDTKSEFTCRGGSFDPGSSSSYHVTIQGGFNTAFGDNSSVSGDFATDTVGIGDIVLQDVQFGVGNVVNSTTGFAVSLMGVGYSANEGVDTPYPNMPELLHQSGAINSRLYSVFLNELGDATGTILFGGIDTSKYTDQLVTIDLVPQEVSSNNGDTSENVVYQFVVPVTGVSAKINDTTTSYLDAAHSTDVLLDTGSSAWTVPTDLFNSLAQPFASAFDDNGNLPCSHQNDDITLTIEFAGQKNITVPVRSLIVPIYDPETNLQYTTQDGQGLCTFMLSPDTSNDLESQGSLTLGDAVLRSMYVVFDLDNAQVSIAQAIANASTDASSSGSGDNIKVVQAGSDGVAKAVGSANGGVATASATADVSSYIVAPEVTASITPSASTAASAVGTATGTDAVPDQGRPSGSQSAATASASHKKGAAASLTPQSFSWSVVAVFGVWVGMAALGGALVL